MLFHFRTLLIAFFSLFIAVDSVAEQRKTFGDYDVHYSVLNTTFLEPDIAQQYGITRGKDQAIVNISVRKNLRDGSDKAQRVVISGTSSDLIHSTDLRFKEVIENNAIYYIAPLRFNDKELRSFTISVQPDPNIKAYTVKFNHTLYEQ